MVLFLNFIVKSSKNRNKFGLSIILIFPEAEFKEF